MNYSVKNVKSMMGMEGLVTRATICRDDVKVGEMFDAADGGPVQFTWVSKEEEKIADAFEKTLPQIPYGDDEMMDSNLDIYFSELCNDYDMMKKVKRMSKTKTVFRLKTAPKGEFVTVNTPYDAGTKAWIVKKYGDAVECIYNERL